MRKKFVLDKETQCSYAIKSLENNPDSVFWSDPDGWIRYVNNAACKKLGYSREELLNMNISEIDLNLKPHHFGAEYDFIKMITSGDLARSETLHRHRDGHSFPVEITMSVLETENNSLGCSFVRDLTGKKNAERRLKEAELRYRSLVESVPIGVYLCQNDQILYANPYLLNLTGYTEIEFLNFEPHRIILLENNEFLNVENQLVLNRNKHNNCDYRIINKQNCFKYIEAQAVSIIYNGSPAYIVTILDITDRKKAENQIKHIAYHDKLTGLPNRYYLFDNLSIYCISGNKSCQTGVLFVDLDRFKLINDTFGHSFGDVVLRKASLRLIDCVRKDDKVFRYGGDEFVIVLDNIDRDKTTDIAQRIIHEFSNPFIIDGVIAKVTPSIGISMSPGDGLDIETLLTNADTAMYHAKEKGKNNFKFFSAINS